MADKYGMGNLASTTKSAKPTLGERLANAIPKDAQNVLHSSTLAGVYPWRHMEHDSHIIKSIN